MINQHLNDNIIQAYALEESKLLPDQQLHMNTCSVCQAKAEGYRLLFTKVAGLPATHFDFDLSAAVLQRIEMEEAAKVNPLTPSRKYAPVRIAWPLILLCVAGVVLIGSTLYYLQDYFADVLAGLSSLITVLVVITIALISGFLGYDEIRKYNKQMNSLDF